MRGAPGLRRQFRGAVQLLGLRMCAHPALDPPHGRHALADRQGPGGPHAAGARRVPRGLRAHLQVPQRARLPEPAPDRALRGHRRLDPHLVGHRQPPPRTTSTTTTPWCATAASTPPSCPRSCPAPRCWARSPLRRRRGPGSAGQHAGRGRRHRQHRRRHRLGRRRRLRHAPLHRHLVVAGHPRALQEDRRLRRHRLGALRRARALAAHGPAGDRRRQSHLSARQRPVPPRRAARPRSACPTSSRSSTAWRRACRRAATASSTHPGSTASAPRSTTARCAPGSTTSRSTITREDIVRAFLEGVALNTRWLMKPVEKFLGRPVEAINLVGGGGAVGGLEPDLRRHPGGRGAPGARPDPGQRPRRRLDRRRRPGRDRVSPTCPAWWASQRGLRAAGRAAAPSTTSASPRSSRLHRRLARSTGASTATRRRRRPCIPAADGRSCRAPRSPAR